ncbi:MAG: type II toxin-antitoxin system RelE/ParE family toxin [Bacteroidota bacterium]
MSYTIEVQEEAIWEMQEAFEWYEQQREGLGYALLDDIEICYQKLCEHPQHYTYINDQYRRIKTNRFPYLLIYEIEDSRVIINSTHHAKRSREEQ